MTKILGGDSHSFFSNDKRYEFIIFSTHIILNYPDPQRLASQHHIHAIQTNIHKLFLLIFLRSPAISMI